MNRETRGLVDKTRILIMIHQDYLLRSRNARQKLFVKSFEGLLLQASWSRVLLRKERILGNWEGLAQSSLLPLYYIPRVPYYWESGTTLLDIGQLMNVIRADVVIYFSSSLSRPPNVYQTIDLHVSCSATLIFPFGTFHELVEALLALYSPASPNY
jgi:hypothetical protein